MYNVQKEELLKKLDTSEAGLSQAEAAERLAKNGLNELEQKDKVSIFRLILDVFKDPMMLILAIVTVVQFVLQEWVEGGVVLAVIVLNAVISVVQVKKAESSLDALKQLTAPYALVKRGGEYITIPVREMVVGDVVALEAGNLVSADGRILESHSLKINESALTGESEAVEKIDTTLSGEKGIGDRTNMVYSGTVCVYGRGEFLVTATAKNAEIGKIADMMNAAVDRQTPLQKRLAKFSKQLGLLIMVVCVAIFAIQIARTLTAEGEVEIFPAITSALMFAVAVAVAAIPEALASIVTIVLASGTKRMAKKGAIIRKLPAVEALGSAGVICTDKTGTLTKNKMTVQEHYGDEQLLLKSMVLCNDALDEQTGDPTETALIAYAKVLGGDANDIRKSFKRIAELPFDSDRKMMSVAVEMDGVKVFTKGAPDVLLSRCTHIIIDGKIQAFNLELQDKILAKNEGFSKKALRVLAYAVREYHKSQDFDANIQEDNLTLIGLTAMIDPPREEVIDAVASAKSAGIKTVMITGDHKTTAQAIAKMIGIDGEALSGAELAAMSEEELDTSLRNIGIYARVSPEDKLRIVKAWQKAGEVCAMTGDGVNDAPSLKQADIGIGMGSGTEVAKDASAMVLTDDNFATIVGAIETGRTIFDNIKKAIAYLFSGNLGAIIAILFALAIGWDSPLTAIQVLFINLLNDSLPAIALGFESGEKNVMTRKPRPAKEGIFSDGLLRGVLIRGVFVGIAGILSQWLGLYLFSNAQIASAMAFTTIILTRTLQTFSARSNTMSMFSGFFKNKLTILAVGVCLLLYGFTLLPVIRVEVFYIPNAFGLNAFGIAFGLAIAAIFMMEFLKLITALIDKKKKP